ncbi:MAG: hypothetical protein FJX72_19240 [Armatimonadetes bacterium]|nr:hypothetical protein [Armatimonadota bacterium]
MVKEAAETILPEFVPFGAIFGLDAPRKVLWGALERDELAGAYLLKGPLGVGKTTLARAFAQAAACTSPAQSPFRACEACRSCRIAASGAHPEISLIGPAGDQTQIWQFWNRPGRPPGALENTLPFSPSIGRRRVYIVERADTLNDAASNSLLKVLEEPPPYAVFVLLTPNAERLLPTILSRCQVVTLTPAPLGRLADYLVQETGAPAERATLVATLAEGRCGAARRLITGPKAYANITQALDLAARLASCEPLAALRLSEEIRKLAAQVEAPAPGADDTSSAAQREAAATSEPRSAASSKARVERGSLGAVLDMLAFAYHDMLAGSLDPSLVAPGSDSSRVEPERCMRALDVLLAARRRLEQNVPPNLLTDWVAVTIAAPPAASSSQREAAAT